MLKRVTFLLILFMSAGVVFGQVTPDDFAVNVSLKDGTTNTVILSVDVDLVGEVPAYAVGYTFAVCHDPADASVNGCADGVSCSNSPTDIIREGTCCAGIASGTDMNAMPPFFFHQVNVVSEETKGYGVVLGCITDMMTNWGIESGEGIELYEITYDVASGTQTEIRVCDDEVGSPKAENIFTYGTAAVKAGTLGSVMIGESGGPTCPENYALNIASTEDNIAVVTLDTEGPEDDTAMGVTGFSFGVAQDSADVAVASVDAGQAVVDALDGADIAWWEATSIDDGVTISAVLSFDLVGDSFRAIPSCMEDQEIAVIHFVQSVGEGESVAANLSLSGDLVPFVDRPAVAIELTDGTGSAVTDITIGDAAAITITEFTGVATSFVRGDVNQDGRHSISDAISIAMYLFDIGAAKDLIAVCEDSADVNDDGTIDIPDAIYLLQYLFIGGDPVPAPVAACGVDTTDDALGCDAFACP